jgi:hypothetical protein
MTNQNVLNFLRETLPHGEYYVYGEDIVMSHSELAGYILGRICEENVYISAHHEEGYCDIDVTYNVSEGVLTVNRSIRVSDDEYGYELIGRLETIE